ncbi:hypothetical protein EDD16DRAFT_64038 [Pisolithus croceorrhizus]|nr:hypothetical protein EDD16DRAFT_64038 [Pisolithus croceorrhizus]KAI6123013.1 hypothetical protein EV401DRAFT_1311726 [Pisolithus croceorrhizus]KAI6148222.1 hypothetical protein EDD17DRAFT_1239039 [Pisolithus thermaeus]
MLRMLAGSIHLRIPTVLRSSVCQRFHARPTSIYYDCTSLTLWSDNFTIFSHSLALLILCYMTPNIETIALELFGCCVLLPSVFTCFHQSYTMASLCLLLFFVLSCMLSLLLILILQC